MAPAPIIQYASDLHLEFYANIPRDGDFFDKLVIPAPNADILVLAGDIGHAEAHITHAFIKWCCTNWKYVLWVYGNHEYYNKKPSEKWRYVKPFTMAEKEKSCKNLQIECPNLHVMNKNSVIFPEFPEYVFIGATLWTCIPDDQHANIGYKFSDFKYICANHTLENGYIRFSPEHWNEFHREDLEYILNCLEEYTNRTIPYKCILITHHLPSYDMILDRYKYDDMNYAFATDLDSILERPEIAAWICGHSHGQKQIPKGPCYLNARGYPNESSQQTYNPSKCISLHSKINLSSIPEENKEADEDMEFV